MSEREDLSNLIWPTQKPQSHSMNTHLSNLRTKLSDWDYEIVTHKTKGLSIQRK